MAITLQTAGTVATGSTSVAPAYPAGVAADRVAVLKVVTKPDTATIATPSGYTSLANGTGGTGAVGIDTGPTRTAIFYRVLAGSETGSVTVTITSGNTSQGVIDIYTATNGFTTGSFGGSTGGDATSGTAWSATMGATLAFANGDLLVGCSACAGNVSTSITSRAVAATSATFGTAANLRAASSNTGNDSLFDTFDFPVTGGPASAAAVYTSTHGAANSGVTAIVRLVEAGLTQVTQTKASDWHVRDEATATKAADWHVRGEATSTKVAEWNVAANLTQVTATKAADWHTRAQATSTKPADWHVRAEATRTRPADWHTRAQASGTKAADWHTAARVTQTKATDWHTLAAVARTRAADWHVRGQATRARAAEWNVASSLVQVTQTKAAAWHVAQLVTGTRPADWHVRTLATSSKAVAWHVGAESAPGGTILVVRAIVPDYRRLVAYADVQLEATIDPSEYDAWAGV